MEGVLRQSARPSTSLLGLDLYCTDHPQHVVSGGWDLEDLSVDHLPVDDLSDVFDVCASRTADDTPSVEGCSWVPKGHESCEYIGTVAHCLDYCSDYCPDSMGCEYSMPCPACRLLNVEVAK